ncbi:MAG: hypothetical protein QOC88_971 [Mycobacterium sp.]|jgi:hypothetical protein|nr:hypothetical protein [Mycobacterium sp.]MDT5164077.1 hypothetical protein [Mycobacterium sp.]MDT5207176.1 hypothetical protein [Mycobacterium sp.]
MNWSISRRAVAAGAIAVAFALAPGAPSGHAKNGDTHVTGMGIEQTIDCNGATLLVDGTRNTVNALGTCWAVTVMGSGHTIVADNVVHDITVYGSNESVFYKNGDPFVWDRGRELGMVNRISHVGS